MKFQTFSMKFQWCSMKFWWCSLKFSWFYMKFQWCSMWWSFDDVPWNSHYVLWSSHNVVVHGLPLVLVLPLLDWGCVQDSPSLGLVFTGLWLCSGFPRSWCMYTGFPRPWSWLFVAEALLRFPLILVLPCRAVLFHRLSQFLSCLCWAVVVHMLPPVVVLPLLSQRDSYTG